MRLQAGRQQAAAIAAIARSACFAGRQPKGDDRLPAGVYGYFVPTYRRDLACIGFDRSGDDPASADRHQPQLIVPGLIGVWTGCLVGWLIVARSSL